MKVRLEGISLKGKNKVREHGEIWSVVEINPAAPVLGGKIGYLIESLAETLKIGSQRVRDKRWVALVGDEDFKIVPISN